MDKAGLLETSRAAQATRARTPTLLLFTAATFVGAWLVFLVQPMVAKMLLPLLGGSPMVWNTAMVFFQGTLLAGYGYAHLSTRALGRRQPVVHVALLLAPLLVLPVTLPADWTPPVDANPGLWLLGVLAVVVGLPYLVVTTASPLLQRWFAATDHPQASDPYFLYAAGNAGSLLALLSYPFLLEPRLSLAAQSRLWSALYVVFAALSAVCAVVALRSPPAVALDQAPGAHAAASLPWTTRARWVLFAFIPSSLFLGVTQFLSTDIASVPLLWILPLSIYLITFILAFARMADLWVRVCSAVLPFVAVVLAATFLEVVWLPVWGLFAVHLTALFFAALLAHARLAQERPVASRLTEFYLLLSLGGVLGGIFNALVAPLLFKSVHEYPLVIVAAMLLRRSHRRPALLPQRWRWIEDLVLIAVLYRFIAHLLVDYQWMGGLLGAAGFWIVVALGVAAVYLVAARPPAFAALMAVLLFAGTLSAGPLLHAERTFFGVYQVYSHQGQSNVLLSGTTIHGFQSTDPEHAAVPVSYHHPSGPIGQLYRALDGDPRLDRVAVVGLGVGTMAAYGEPGQDYDFYEIDPAVLDIADDPDLFTYLRDAEADVDVILGDGRLKLQDADERYGLIFLNAFTSDAIPMHLLTREAVEIYLDQLMPGGILVFNVTNRYLELEPMLGAIADDLGLAAIGQLDDDWDEDVGKYASHWVLLARNAEDFGALRDDDRWHTVTGGAGVRPWTDTFSNILSVYDWE